MKKRMAEVVYYMNPSGSTTYITVQLHIGLRQPKLQYRNWSLSPNKIDSHFQLTEFDAIYAILKNKYNARF